MSVSFNSPSFGHFGLAGAAAGAPQGAAPASDGSKTPSPAADIRTSAPPPSTMDAISGSEPVADVPDSALSRDDDLGRLVKAAFALPPPPMPAFGSV